LTARLLLQFRGSAITSDAGLLPCRELDDAAGLSDTGRDVFADARAGKNGPHRLVSLLGQSVFGRLAGYLVQAKSAFQCLGAVN
jgi:hypothetical protein